MKITIFPYDATLYPLIDYLSISNKYTDIFTVSPPWYRLNNKDVSWAINAPPLSITVTDDLLTAISNSDHLFISNGDALNLLNCLDINLYSLAFRKLKTIFVSSQILYEWLCNTFALENVVFISNITYPIKSYSQLHRFNIPIILIGGAVSQCSTDRYFTRLSLALSKKYNTTSISTSAYNCLCGGYLYPSSLFTNEYTLTEKVLYINNYLADMISKNHSEIVLLKMPDAISRYNHNHYDSFGISSYMLSQAINNSSMLISLPWATNYNNDLVSYYGDIAKYRFTSQLIGIIVDNIKLEPGHQNIEYLFLSDEFTNSCFNNSSNIVWGAFDADFDNKVMQRIQEIYNL